jgi:AcrR family transcriptional regulator
LHPPRRRTSKKGRYHHGDLREAALSCALALVEKGGPAAVTLRGVARLLGVTAPALVYHFRSILGFKSEVADAVLTKAAKSAGATLQSRVRPPREVAAAWIDFAADNPNLYRLAAGEGWHGAHAKTAPQNGIYGPTLPTPSPRRLLQDTFVRHTRRFGAPRGDVEWATTLAFTIHGMALARVDGVGGDAVTRALERTPWAEKPAWEPPRGQGPPGA